MLVYDVSYNITTVVLHYFVLTRENVDSNAFKHNYSSQKSIFCLIVITISKASWKLLFKYITTFFQSMT